MRHVKIRNPIRRWLAVEIPRCGCTTLKTLAYRDFFHREPRLNIHHELGYDPAMSWGLIQPYSHADPDALTFAVWRDPVARSESTWRSFTQANRTNGYREVHGCTPDQWVEHVARHIDTPAPDIHIRRQRWFYAPTEVDWIVSLDDLSLFLATLGHHEPPRMASSRRVETPHRFADDHRARLAGLYAPDYELASAPNFWRAP